MHTMAFLSTMVAKYYNKYSNQRLKIDDPGLYTAREKCVAWLVQIFEKKLYTSILKYGDFM